jgi:serpin B
MSRNLAPVVVQSTEVAVVNGINTLGLDLLGTTSGNVVVAPFSASLSLARLRDGAMGDTLTAISGIMHVNGLGDGVDSAFNDLDLGVNGRINACLLGAQTSQATAGAWAQAHYGYRLTYLDALAENFGLKPSRVDFALDQSDAAQKLSDWSLQAVGLAPLVTTTQDTRLVLGDAVQLNAAWADPFDPALTETNIFKLLDSSTVNVPFMLKTATLPQTSGNGYMALALPLSGGQQLLVVLPDEGRYTEIQTALTAEMLKQIAAALVPAQVNLSFPKFSIKGNITLDLGVAATKGVADFSGMDGTRNLYVASTVHGSRLSVAEAGLQAGSVTQIALEDLNPGTLGSSSSGLIDSDITITIGPLPTITVLIARPFIFAVRDSVTGAIIFMGRVMDPSL